MYKEGYQVGPTQLVEATSDSDFNWDGSNEGREEGMNLLQIITLSYYLTRAFPFKTLLWIFLINKSPAKAT